jgi:hypothetical protein
MDSLATKPGLVKRGLRKAATMAVVTVAFGYFYGWAAPRAFPILPVPGFGYGMLHGALMPIALPSLILGKDVPIYATVNSGRLYKIGYIAGINLCGLAFFGPLFWRPARGRNEITESNSRKSQ